MKAVSRYNRMAVMFDYANTPTLNELKAGQHLTVFSAPNFKQLQKELKEAKQAGIPYDEMKEPLDKLLSKLNDITPVAEELDAYYKSKGYTTDNYAKEQQLGPKYVQLYEQLFLFMLILIMLRIKSIQTVCNNGCNNCVMQARKMLLQHKRFICDLLRSWKRSIVKNN